MDRRNFLKLAFVGAAIAATPIALKEALASRLPMIYGDGEHDDWEGLQAALDGKQFIAREACVVKQGNTYHLRPGTYMSSHSLHFHPESHVINGHGSIIDYVNAPEGTAGLTWHNSKADSDRRRTLRL